MKSSISPRPYTASEFRSKFSHFLKNKNEENFFKKTTSILVLSIITTLFCDKVVVVDNDDFRFRRTMTTIMITKTTMIPIVMAIATIIQSLLLSLFTLDRVVVVICVFVDLFIVVVVVSMFIAVVLMLIVVELMLSSTIVVDVDGDWVNFEVTVVNDDFEDVDFVVVDFAVIFVVIVAFDVVVNDVIVTGDVVVVVAIAIVWGQLRPTAGVHVQLPEFCIQFLEFAMSYFSSDIFESKSNKQSIKSYNAIATIGFSIFKINFRINLKFWKNKQKAYFEVH